MTDARDLEAQIAEVFAERLQVRHRAQRPADQPVEVPSPDLDLFEGGVVDSLMFVKLLTSLEQRFGFRISFEELEIDDFRTLRHIARFVAAKRAPQVRRVSAS